ncbi:hypothetical protein ACXZ9C_10700 [Streptococcus agalactiae]
MRRCVSSWLVVGLVHRSRRVGKVSILVRWRHIHNIVQRSIIIIIIRWRIISALAALVTFRSAGDVTFIIIISRRRFRQVHR